jgi:hypothetical protein
MDLKKNKKLKKKYNGFSMEVRNIIGTHIYRSRDKDAPFSEWERITDKPDSGNSTYFHGKDHDQYFYKATDVDRFGNESEPYTPKITGIRDGKRVEIKPETTIKGMRMYWSTDPDLPLEQWNVLNEEPFEDEKTTFTCPVKEPFYLYGKYVNLLGEEFGKPSVPERIVPKP